MEYIALQNHGQHFHMEAHRLNHNVVLLQGRQEQEVVGLEWGFARRPKYLFGNIAWILRIVKKRVSELAAPFCSRGRNFCRGA